MLGVVRGYRPCEVRDIVRCRGVVRCRRVVMC